MLYDENGNMIPYKDLPTAEKIESELSCIFRTAIDGQAHLLDIKKWIIAYIVIHSALEISVFVGLMLKAMQ